jgi:hypothetical protein
MARSRVYAGAALVGFLVQKGAFLDILRHVRDMDPEPVA